MTTPLIPGFHPDPSWCRVGSDYYLAHSSFEYLPGIPIYRSGDLENWTLIGHVATRPDQLQVAETPTNGGAWAPTLRHHGDQFYLVVTDAIGGRGTVLFTATNAAGPWSDGLEVRLADGAPITGIDPDLCWDADGHCLLSYAGFNGEGDALIEGILQVRLDTATGRAVEEPRLLWGGTGTAAPEAPHLYRVEDRWYLLVTEGTGPGQAISIARASSPTGPFEACPANPVLTARGTDWPIQNLGHGDLLQAADGQWWLALAGVRPMGMTAAFSPLGRETFTTAVTWQDGWPSMDLPAPSSEGTVHSVEDFDAELGPEWIGIRHLPREVSSVTERPGWLRLKGVAQNMSGLSPAFVGRRQTTQAAQFTALLDVSAGAGGLVVRIDDENYVQVRIDQLSLQTNVRLNTIEYDHAVTRPDGVDLIGVRITADPVPRDSGPERFGCDVLRMSFALADPFDESNWFEMAVVDGRYLTPEVCESFNGRVAGVFCEYGKIDVDWFTVKGSDSWEVSPA